MWEDPNSRLEHLVDILSFVFKAWGLYFASRGIILLQLLCFFQTCALILYPLGGLLKCQPHHAKLRRV